MVKVARLYHEHGIRQPEIARRLHVRQARVSRLLKQAELDGIVRTTVVVPAGVQTGARGGARGALRPAGGGRRRAARRQRGEHHPRPRQRHRPLPGGEPDRRRRGRDHRAGARRCWPPSTRCARCRPRPAPSARCSSSAASATPRPRRTRRASPSASPTSPARAPRSCSPPASPARSTRARRSPSDRFVQEALDGLADVTLALVGIGALEPSQPAPEQRQHLLRRRSCEALGAQGAVGDICLRFFDADGERVESDVDRRVIGVTPRAAPRGRPLVGIAGGARKYEAILGALRGGWINVLITDSTTAERLLAEPCLDLTWPGASTNGMTTRA